LHYSLFDEIETFEENPDVFRHEMMVKQEENLYAIPITTQSEVSTTNSLRYGSFSTNGGFSDVQLPPTPLIKQTPLWPSLLEQASMIFSNDLGIDTTTLSMKASNISIHQNWSSPESAFDDASYRYIVLPDTLKELQPMASALAWSEEDYCNKGAKPMPA